MDSDASLPARTVFARVLDARVWLAVYVAVLAAIAFWPSPVDREAGPLLAYIQSIVPWLTYERIEFTANIVLFVPLGILLTLILRKRRWVLPLALGATFAIEAIQAALLSERTPAISDIIANVLGAAIGMLVVLLAQRWSQTRNTAGSAVS
ncbi:VanZ family protein [Microbacterium sp. SS28]|uniref:VanZ family protein n=1 Tax=Microbacterium sp. SS28 TaxID=2919948 RepID=UPI001FA9D814|nr:VanZ family protein [Microbacterium sp. SS28]